MKYKQIFSFLAISGMVFLAACSGPKSGYQTVEASQAEQLVTSKKVSVLDVRTPREYSQGHLPNAVNIDYLNSDFEKQLEALDKDKKYLVYCRSGQRSSEAVEVMKKKGFRNVTNMLGGITAWSGPTEK